jgi:hypothetical protein
MSASTAQLVLLDSESGSYSFYTWQNIMMACWSKRATGPAVQRLTRLRESVDREHPEGVSVIYLIGEMAGLPTAEARAGVKELMARFSHRRACLAVVIQGDGFWLSAMRGAITGVRMLVPAKFPMGIFGHVEDVVEWLPRQHEERTGIRIAPTQLLVVLKDLMARL